MVSLKVVGTKRMFVEENTTRNNDWVGFVK